VCQAREAAGQLGQPAIGEKLVDGSGLGQPSSGDHRHCPEQSAAASTYGAKDLTLGLPTRGLNAAHASCGGGQARGFGHDLLKTET
jgi:hypothetical protein